MNAALISKWKWRILVEKEAIWRDIINARYGNTKFKVLVGDNLMLGRKDSIWWRALIISDNYENLQNKHFAGAIDCSVGNGEDIPFWYACWLGLQTLMEAYPELYRFAINHLEAVCNVGTVRDGRWDWRVDKLVAVGSEGVVQQQHFVWLAELHSIMQGLHFRDSSPDGFVWNLCDDGVFTVSSCYERFKEKLSGPPLCHAKVTALGHLWKIKSPSKILFFGWRLILEKLATKDQLARRGILVEGIETACVFCQSEEETLTHLFAGCSVTLGIWRKVFGWVDLGTIMSLEDFVSFFHNCSKIKSIIKRTIGAVIWLSTVWSLWLKRNARIFKNEAFNFADLISEIVFNSWRWLNLFYKRVEFFNFYHWNILPLSCFEA
ncbi:uncharacterized protein LOC131657821 [Vicia villosa]|uniref:uncharacterized protein LOC131657821 n=1 Tax=Vicia villosa TaxID=3911 RepID=UPI00273B2E72|nr:uncharacterized protein LOC131657821 [Vicia villosa]